MEVSDAPERIWVDRWGDAASSKYQEDDVEFVRADLYAALQARLAEVEAERDAAMMTGHDLAKEEYREKLQAAEAALATARPLGKVKPLEWEEPCERNNQVHVARCVFGEYYIGICGGRHSAWLEAHVKPHENQIGDDVGSLHAAKALADADYKARVLALIDKDAAIPAHRGSPMEHERDAK